MRWHSVAICLMALAAPEMEGRRSAEPGGLRARAWLVERFSGLGLTAFPGGFERPFAFTQTSIRALWKSDRSFRREITGAANVVGFVPGTQDEGVLLVSAHYDHLGIRDGKLYPGADDNASGVAGLLSLATWARAHPLRHRVVFAAFDAEELGLRGAQAFVADPPIPIARIAAVLNMDMIGRPEGGGLVVTGTWRHPELRPIVEEAARHASVPVYLRHERPFYIAGFVEDWTGASDQGPFAELGVPFLYLGVEDHAGYHDPSDTPERVPAAAHAGATELALDLLRGLDVH